jgi:UrcA family protein
MSLRLSALAALAALAWTGTAADARADGVPSTPTPSIRVAYADLDLTTDRGITELYARVRVAARQVCGYPATGTRVDPRYAACVRVAVDRAIAQLGVPALAELHRELAAPLGSPGAECALPTPHRRLII